MRFHLFSLLVPGVLILAGCGAQRGLVREQRTAIERLQRENAEMRFELGQLRDSLQFYDDVESGVYHQQMSSLRARIAKLEYDLAGERPEGGEEGETIGLLPTDVLFEPATARLTEEGARLIAGLAEEIRTKHPEAVLRVEGHTDDVPIGTKLKETFPSNWELAAIRAATVARQLQREHDVDGRRIEVVGYGPYRPAVPNSSEANRRQNRRVRVAAL